MRTFDCPRCPLCSTEGERRYSGLCDRLFSAPGEWNLNQCRNDACGILWLDPMPVEEDLGEAYRGYLTHGRNLLVRLSREKLTYLHKAYGYPAPPGADSLLDTVLAGLFKLRFRRRADLDGQVFYLPAADGGRLLDVGCGSGDGMALMATLGWRVEGVEIDPEAVETARSKGLTVHADTLAAQQFPNDMFDAVTLRHVIEHVPRPVELIAECRRILKPGGMLVMLTPNAAGLGHRLYRSSWVGLEPPRHLQVFTPAALETTTRQAAFTDIEIRSTSRGAEWIALASQAIRKTGRGYSATSWVRRRWTRLLQAVEALALQVNDRIGEEIVVRARKDV